MKKKLILYLFILIPITGFVNFLLADVAEAIPAFARKYNVTCTVCHTKPPRLNPFGEAFHMAGYQIPMTESGEILKKRKVGRVNLEKELLNIFAMRFTGNFADLVQADENDSELNLNFPQVAELYFAGTFTKDISYFLSFEHEASDIEGEGDNYKQEARFGLSREAFLMFNLDRQVKKLFGGSDDGHKMDHGGEGGIMSHGPMIMIGKIDPSTNFSYSTNRQFMEPITGQVDEGKIRRFTLQPFAFSSKFYGMRTGKGDLVEVTKPSLYNTTGDMGADFHGMLGPFLFELGVMQGLEAGFKDANMNKDYYFVGRYNFGKQNYLSGSFSVLYYMGNDTGTVKNASDSSETTLIDWVRYGFGFNVKYKLFDIYGAFMWDKIDDLPETTLEVFDDSASGFTIEADYIATNEILLSVRYDRLDSGGFLAEKEDGEVVSLQARYYVRDNFALYLRDSYNMRSETVNPLNSYKNAATFGVDFDF